MDDFYYANIIKRAARAPSNLNQKVVANHGININDQLKPLRVIVHSKRVILKKRRLSIDPSKNVEKACLGNDGAKLKDIRENE